MAALVGLCQVQFLQAIEPDIFVERKQEGPTSTNSEQIGKNKIIEEQEHFDFIHRLKISLNPKGGKDGKVRVVKSGGPEETLGLRVEGNKSDTISVLVKDNEKLEAHAQGEKETFLQKIQEQQRTKPKIISVKDEILKDFRKKLIETLGKDFFKKSELLKKTLEYKEINKKIKQFYTDFRDSGNSTEELRKKMNKILDQIRGEKEVAFDAYNDAQKHAQDQLGVNRLFTTATPTVDLVKIASDNFKKSRKENLENLVQKHPNDMEIEHRSILTGIKDIETEQGKIQLELDKKPSFFSRSPKKKYKKIRNQLAKDKKKLEFDRIVIQEKTRNTNVKELEEQSLRRAINSGKNVQDNEGQYFKIGADFKTNNKKSKLDKDFHTRLDSILNNLPPPAIVEGGQYIRKDLLGQINEKLETLQSSSNLNYHEKVKLQEGIIDLAEKAVKQFKADRESGVRFARYEQPLKKGNFPAEKVLMKNTSGLDKDGWDFYTNRLDGHTTATSRAFYEEINTNFNEVIKGKDSTLTELVYNHSATERYGWGYTRGEEAFRNIVKKINNNLEEISQPGISDKSIENIKINILEIIRNLKGDVERAASPFRSMY